MTTFADPVELTLESSVDRPRPYTEVEVTVRFEGPGGRTVRRSAYWDGGRTWRVRFAPTAAGTWHWRSSATDAHDSGLHDVSGEVRCEAGASSGFLRVAADGGHLERADGDPFLWLGDTHWRFTAERWDDPGRSGWDSWFRGIVDRRVEQGFTVYQVNLMLFDWGAVTSDYFEDDAFEHPALDHHRAVDARLGHLAQRGLVAAIGLGWNQAVDRDPAAVVRFARYAVARWGAAPVVWTLGGEAVGYEPELVDERRDAWRLVAEATRAADDYAHPITVHSINERPIATTFTDQPWLDLALNQHGHGDLDLSPDWYRRFRDEHPRLPLVEGESLYEGLISVEPAGRRPVTDTMVRHAAYRAIQSGCCGYTYGAQGCWNAAPDARTGRSSWGSLPWYDGVELPGGAQLGHLRRFYDDVGWADLTPTDCFVPGGPINTRFNPAPATADADRTVTVVYFPETFRIDEPAGQLHGIPGPHADLRWYDPRSGTYTARTETAVTDGVLTVPTKPDEQDWLLLVDARPRTRSI